LLGASPDERSCSSGRRAGRRDFIAVVEGRGESLEGSRGLFARIADLHDAATQPVGVLIFRESYSGCVTTTPCGNAIQNFDA